MAKEKVTVTLCDNCRRAVPVLRTRISFDGQRGMIAELCADCRKPIDELIESVGSKRKPIQSVATLELTSMEEIEAQKKKARRSQK